ncbi:MAG TPA: response regulator [Gammaproteobacteria bacterium]|nr:response regulator [Gammaproteobacteria bacterium]
MQPDIRVLLVDDHDLVRAGIKRVLTDVPYIKVVGEVNSGEEAVRVAPELKPEVVLLDFKMPKMDGLETTHALLAIDPNLKILMVSVCLDELLLPKLFKEGVAGYFSKNCSVEEMIKAIKVVHEGQRYISPALTQQLGLKSLDSGDLFIFDVLSERELQVVLMIVDGLTIHEISDKLGINRKTINSYRSRSFQKLNVKNDVELTLLAARQGLIENSNQ